MKRIGLILLALLGAICCSTGSGDNPPAAGVLQPPDITVQIVGTDTGFQARSQNGVVSYSAGVAGAPPVKLERNPDQPTHTLSLTNVGDGKQALTVLALDGNGQVVSHYLAELIPPGEVIVHADRFTQGPVRRLGDTGAWVEQYSLPVFGQPDLTETYWNCAVDVPPPFVRSSYDVIGLHRVVSDTPRPGRVLLFLPGAQCNGGLYTQDETRDFRLYLANRGYDVYSLDYRTHFAPPFNIAGVSLPGLVTPDLTFMAAWNSARFVDDVGTAIGWIKSTSQVDKLFLAGFSSGGQFAYFYACREVNGRLGQEDLLGLIAMDGGPWQQGTNQPPASLEIAEGRAAVLGGDTPANRAVCQKYGSDPGPGFYTENFGDFLSEGFLDNALAYLVDENAPNPLNPEQSAADFLIDRFQTNWGLNDEGDGQFSNIARGYNSLPTLMAWSVLAADTYWPIMQDIEDAVVTNYSGPPDGPYRVPLGSGLPYLDNLARINIPQFVVGTSGLTNYLGNRMAWKFQGIALSATPRADAEQHILEHFGHLDALSGTKANQFVAQPMLNWLDRH
ncbi:MAG: hypothetical protein AMXMBFR33_52430 [Candidatus Xenobia bacterium]